MNLLDGIRLHELVLMILGFILGLVLIFVFLFMALRGRINMKLLYGFIAPLIMIGYPSIQSISFSKDVIQIDKLVKKVNENPSDTIAQRALIEQIQTLPKSRCVTSADALTTIADAQSALGLYDSAKVTINKALELSPNSNKAHQSQQDIQEKLQIQRNFEQKVDKIKQNINDLEKKPNDVKLLDSIATRLNEIKKIDAPVRVQQVHAVLVAKAVAIIGEKQAAQQINEAILKANPKSDEAKALKEELKTKIIEKRFGTKRPNVRIQTTEKTTTKPTAKPSPTAPKVDAPVMVQIDMQSLKFQLVPKAAEALKKWDNDH